MVHLIMRAKMRHKSTLEKKKAWIAAFIEAEKVRSEKAVLRQYSLMTKLKTTQR